jgi:uncharacterized membrane protein YbhN (UPF0104 family)
MKKYFLLGLSFLVTGVLVYYLLTRSSWTEWQRILLHLKPGYLVGYLFLYAVGLLLRTFRYHFLLKSVKTPVLPSFWHLTLVTSVRNMLVDFFPARTGSLSYIVLLNGAFKVDLSPCLSSFTYAFLFDQLAMAPLLASAILIDSLTSHKNYLWLWGIAVLIMVIALLLILSLEPLVKIFSQWSGRNNHRWQKYPWLRKLDHQLHNLAQSFSILRQAKIFWPILGLSVMIRGVKYIYLYILLSAVLQALSGHWIQLPFWVVLLGLVASEASAGLPISGIAGFGFYEGILSAILSTQGIHPSQAVLVSFAMHFFTQIVDYSLGSGALIYILVRWAGLKKKDQTLTNFE